MSNSNTLSDIVAGGFVLVSITVRSRSFVKKDKNVTNQAIHANHAAADAGSFQKNLFASASGELRALKKAGAALRTYLYNKTAPYDTGQGTLQKGDRLLAATKSMDFLAGFAELESVYNSARADFKAVYDQRKMQALGALGAMADASDYPSVDELDDYFGVELSITPVPKSAQLPDALPTEVMEQAAKRMAETEIASISNAIADTRERLGDELSRMAGVFKRHAAGEKTKLYGSLLENMRNVTDLLEATNITNDPALTAVVQRVRSELCPPTRQIDDYKLSTSLAEQASEAAASISAQLESAPSVGSFDVVSNPTPQPNPTPTLDQLEEIMGEDISEEVPAPMPEAPEPMGNDIPDLDDMF